MPDDTQQTTPESDLDSAIESSRQTAGSDIPFPDDPGPAHEPPQAQPNSPEPRENEPAYQQPQPGVDLPPEPQIEYRFKDHSEAEKGYKHLQGRATKAEQRAAELQKRLEEYDSRLKAIETARNKADEERQKADLDTWITDRTEKTVREIEQLDPTSPTYHRDIAQAWARNHSDVFSKRAELDKPPEPAPQSHQPATHPPPDAPDAPDETAVQRQVMDAVEKAGLDWQDPLFTSFAQQAPPDIPLDRQIEWVKTKMNDYLAAKMAAQRQQTEQPMDRTGPGRPAPASDAAGDSSGEYTFSDVLDSAHERRRL